MDGRAAVKAIEEDQAAKKKLALDELEAQKQAALKKRKDEISKKYIIGPEDEE